MTAEAPTASDVVPAPTPLPDATRNRVSLYWIAIRFGDVLGTHLYEQFGGFAPA
jgi:hypothetical protein